MIDKKHSIMNVSASIFFKIIIAALTILSRRFLIRYIGNEANGINSLYLSIVGVLSIVELGIGSAISFSMYAPIINGEKSKVAALYRLFTKMYRIIGLIILMIGLCITPFIPNLIENYSGTINLYLTFLIMLASTVITYVYSSKVSLINAYKNNYVTTTITSLGQILRFIMQILVLLLFRSFTVYLVCRIVSELFQWIGVEWYAKKHYREIMELDSVLDQDTREGVTKNIKSMFIHKIGGTIFTSIDNIVISSFFGVFVLGLYSNYVAIMAQMVSLISLLFSSLTSVVGHMCAEGSIKDQKKYYNMFYRINLVIGCIFFLGYYGVIDSLIRMIFGQELLMAPSISFVLTLTYFTLYLRQSTLLFRDATGTFYYDKWKAIVECVVNIVLSVIFANWFGVAGVLIATCITNLLICDIVEPFVLYKHVFHESPREFYIKNYLCILGFTFLLMVVHICKVSYQKAFIEFILNGCLSVAIAMIPTIIIILWNKDLRNKILRIKKRN